MCKWILIDNHTGARIGASTDLDGFDGTPTVLAQYLDQAQGRHGRTYFELPFSAGANGQSGYYCYRAPPELPIESVERDCEPVCFVCVSE